MADVGGPEGVVMGCIRGKTAEVDRKARCGIRIGSNHHRIAPSEYIGSSIGRAVIQHDIEQAAEGGNASVHIGRSGGNVGRRLIRHR